MKLLKRTYERWYGKPAPYYYNYDAGTILMKPVRKWLTNSVAPNCPFNNIRILIYRICGFDIGRHVFIGMHCYLDDMCYERMHIGNNVTISYGVYFACHGKNQKHNEIVLKDGVYIGMRANVIGKNREKNGGYYDWRKCHCGSLQSGKYRYSGGKNSSGSTCENPIKIVWYPLCKEVCE